MNIVSQLLAGDGAVDVILHILLRHAHTQIRLRRFGDGLLVEAGAACQSQQKQKNVALHGRIGKLSAAVGFGFNVLQRRHGSFGQLCVKHLAAEMLCDGAGKVPHGGKGHRIFACFCIRTEVAVGHIGRYEDQLSRCDGERILAHGVMLAACGDDVHFAAGVMVRPWRDAVVILGRCDQLEMAISDAKLRQGG